MLAGFYKKKTSFKKRLVKVIKIFLKKRKTKNPQYVCNIEIIPNNKKNNMIKNNIKISHIMKNNCFIIWKNRTASHID